MSGSKRAIGDTPLVENYPVLKAWLNKHAARCLWGTHAGDGQQEIGISCWNIPRARGVFLITTHANGHGWGVFTESGSILTDAALEDAEKRLGLT